MRNPGPSRVAGGRGRPGPDAFTLVEVLVAVSLLVMIILVASYIFETTIKAVGLTQANNELNANLATFYQKLRADLAGVEPDGMLVIGRRHQQGFGSARDRSNENKRSFRNDWMVLFLSTEHDASGDNCVIGQWARVLYGHGRVSDAQGYGFVDQTSSMPLRSGTHSDYSNLGTDWVVMRHQISVLSQLRLSPKNPARMYGLGYENVEKAEEIDQYSTGAMYQRTVLSHTVRDLRWHAWYNSQWVGSVTVDYGPDGRTGTGRLAIYEPLYYFFMPVRHPDARKFYALPHCAEFRVQYAMAEDLRAGGGGSIRWRDPPAVGESGYYDPNFRSGVADPAHPSAQVVTSGANAGRLVFAPGDRWPAMLKVAVHVFDPSDRFEGGRRTEIVVPVP